MGLGHLQPWLDLHLELPTGALFCVINGPAAGRRWAAAAVAGNPIPVPDAG
jgi:hypothetical protein